MSKHPRRSPDVDDEGRTVVPEADIDAWAAEERKRRQAWLEGPTEEEKQAWAERERRRRLRAMNEERSDLDIETMIADGRRLSDRFQHDLTLAVTGAVNQLVSSPYRLLGSLVRSGRELEEDYYTPRRRRRRVPLDAED